MMVGLVISVVQKLCSCTFRSIELGIPMVRSSNKGISGLISPMGEIISSTIQANHLPDVKIPNKLDTTAYIEFEVFMYFLIVLFL